MRWADPQHENVKFQKWYVLDPKSIKSGNYLVSSQARLEGNLIAGRQNFVFLYIHINFDLTKPEESITHNNNSNKDELVVPIQYSIDITKQKTQLRKDFETLLEILGAQKSASTDTEVGYFSFFKFDSNFKTSQLNITETLKTKNQTGTPTKDQMLATKANAFASKTYTNEGPSYIGLSFAVPLASYKDLQLDSGSLQPKTIDRQNIYVTVDGYYPPAQPGLMMFRYIPHPFFGIPIKGQPLRHTMLGLGIGLKWIEPFGGVVFDIQKIPTGRSTQTTNRLALKGVWGLKVSVSAVKKGLSK